MSQLIASYPNLMSRIIEPQDLPTDPAEWSPWTERAQAVPEEVRKKVRTIVDDIAERGDRALSQWSEQFDGIPARIVPTEEWHKAADGCPKSVAQAIDENHERIRDFHARQAPTADEFEATPGVLLGRRPVPLDAVACYVPGGRAQYPSTVLMTVTPAAIAGVGRIVVTTPPTHDGSVDPVVAYAAKAAGATEMFAAGGAQAIAALAHGTQTIERVQAIVGPGNAFVTAAKKHVSDLVRIDAPAGPSELLVLADAGAPAGPIAWDLLAQAEHDPDAQVLLVTDDATLADGVADELMEGLPKERRARIIDKSLRNHGAILVASDMAEAVAFTNAYGGEHVAVVTADPLATANQITAAGSLFLGPHAPVTLGDYGSGTNHVLPTMGFAHQRGGLAVDDFVRWITWQQVTADGLATLAPSVTTLADAEGLHAHARAVTRRLEDSP